MRKTTITLALLLSFVLCLFCFASCGKKTASATTGAEATASATTGTEATAAATTAQATNAATTAYATLAPHVHTPDDHYTVDRKPTCTTPGEQSYYCSVCGEKIPGTTVPIEIDPNAHKVDEWTVTEEATLLNPVGTMTGHCSVCDRDVEKEYDVEIRIYDASSSEATTAGGPVTSFDLGDEHFYPTEAHPDGQDFLFEFSFLWNETIANTTGDTDLALYVGTGNSSKSLNNFALSLRDDPGSSWLRGGAQVAGHFETIYQSGDLIYPTAEQLAANPALEFPAIGEYGWHRIGVRVHQDAAIVENEVKYTLTSTLYVDGEMVLSFHNDPAKMAAKNVYLFTAEIVDGNLVYSDGTVTAGQSMQFNFAGATQPACLVFADRLVTCGTDFVQKVVAVSDPADETLEVADGVNVSAKLWYTVPCDEHVWDGNDTVTKAATLLADGTRVKICANCGATISTETIKYEPTVVSFTDASSGAYNPVKANLRELEGDKRFYPTDADAEGNDLLIEYSVLWNESMLNFVGTAKPYFHSCLGKDNGTQQINNISYWSPVADNSNADCKFAGGFEYGVARTSEPGNPYPQMTKPVGDSIDEFPNIGGNNGGDGTDQGEPQWGWHRVQVRLHEDVTNADALKADTTAGATNATYKCTVTTYIDGVLVSILSCDTMTDGSNSYDNKLFTAASDGEGGIVYTDVREEEWIHAMRINSTKAKDTTTIYVVYGDVFVSCGKTFIQNVEKVATPEAAQFEVAEGVNVSAAMFYQAKAD